VACLRQQEVDSPALKEVRTFDRTPSDMAVLADWLVSQGVTHVAIERHGWAWKPLYNGQQRAFSVLLFDAATTPGEKDVRWMADLLAYGLLDCHMAPPEPPSASLRPHRGMRLLVVGVLFIALVAAYGVWRYANAVATARPPTPPLPHAVQWQPGQVSYQASVGEPFVLSLPTLERTPAGVPVDVALEASSDAPSWLELDRERLHIHGTAPPTAKGRTYRLSIRAQAEQGGDSRLVVLLTITGPPDRSTPPARLPSHWMW
jgi:hypothetical protein